MSSCVEMTAVEKSFGATRALASLTLRAEAGQVTAVLGPNGAGKSTAMSICEGLQEPDAGQVRILGMDPIKDADKLRARVGVMIQDGGLPIMARAEEMLRHVARLYSRTRNVDELIELLGIAAFARTSIRRLSGGQRQRLAMAIALVGLPDLVFLDEPSAGMDPQARQAVWHVVEDLRAQGVSVVLTTHLMDEAARLADQVIIIDHGEVIATGSPAELIAHSSAPTPPAPPPSAVKLSGNLTPAALAELQQLAGRFNLTMSDQSPDMPPTRTLEDVFLELTGRSLR